VEAAFVQLLIHMNEFNYQTTRSTANASPAHHAIAEAKYDDDIGLGNPFGGIAMYTLESSLTTSSEPCFSVNGRFAFYGSAYDSCTCRHCTFKFSEYVDSL